MHTCTHAYVCADTHQHVWVCVCVCVCARVCVQRHMCAGAAGCTHRHTCAHTGTHQLAHSGWVPGCQPTQSQDRGHPWAPAGSGLSSGCSHTADPKGQGGADAAEEAAQALRGQSWGPAGARLGDGLPPRFQSVGRGRANRTRARQKPGLRLPCTGGHEGDGSDPIGSPAPAPGHSWAELHTNWVFQSSEQPTGRRPALSSPSFCRRESKGMEGWGLSQDPQPMYWARVLVQALVPGVCSSYSPLRARHCHPEGRCRPPEL